MQAHLTNYPLPFTALTYRTQNRQSRIPYILFLPFLNEKTSQPFFQFVVVVVVVVTVVAMAVAVPT